MSDIEFIQSVKNVIPNPPFKIIIESNDQIEFRDENSFKDVKIDVKEDNWEEHENIRRIEFKIEDKGKTGIMGFVVVYLLEDKLRPVEELKLLTKEVSIDGKSYELNKSYSMGSNEINMHSSSIGVNAGNEIRQTSSYNSVYKSKSKFSLHGIEIPTTLFPDSWRLQKNQVQINWPLTLQLVVDVCGNRDLDLNSSRTQVIYSDKWYEFEEELAYVICNYISKSVDLDYWNSLRGILLKNAKSNQFISGLKRVSK